MKKTVFGRFLPALLFIGLVSFSFQAVAQVEGEEGYDNYYNPDSTGGEEDYSETNPDDYNEDGSSKKPDKKPYVRIVLPYDTLTELVTYTNIVEQPDSYLDSLYLRSQRYIMQKFKLDEKAFKESSKDMEKIIMTLNMPFHMKINKFVVQQSGTLEFQLALRFKDGKYKYKIDHVKHNLPGKGTKPGDYVYIEYYMNSARNIVGNDKILRAADAEINKVINEILKALQEPVTVDEDDF